MLRSRSHCLLAVAAAVLLSLATTAKSAPPGDSSAGSAASTSSDSNPSTIVEAPPLARSLGLGTTATPEQMAEVAAKIRKTWKEGGTGCGLSFRDGRRRGFCSTFYHSLLPGDMQETHLSLGNVLDKELPGGCELVTLSGPGFVYDLQDGVFVLHLTKPSR